MTRPKKPLPDLSGHVPVKATDAQILQRVATVHKLLVAGVGRASILQHAAEKWSLSERQADEYIARVKGDIAERTDKDKESNLNLAIQRMSDIYQQCYAAKNYKGAITAQVEINKLLGLYAPTKQEGTGEGGAFVIKLVRETGFDPKPTIHETDE